MILMYQSSLFMKGCVWERGVRFRTEIPASEGQPDRLAAACFLSLSWRNDRIGKGFAGRKGRKDLVRGPGAELLHGPLPDGQLDRTIGKGTCLFAGPPSELSTIVAG